MTRCIVFTLVALHLAITCNAKELSPEMKACVERKRAYFTKQRLQDAEANCHGILRQDCSPGVLKEYTKNFMRVYGPRKNFGVKECRKELKHDPR